MTELLNTTIMEQNVKPMPTIAERVNTLQINAGYQSPVQHLPKHISPTPDDDQSDPFSAIQMNTKSPSITIDGYKISTKFDPCSQKKIPYTPFIQSLLFWCNISIFILCITAGIFGYLIKSILLNTCLIIVCVVCGLILSYSYKTNIKTILSLKNKLLQVITLQNISTPSVDQNPSNEPEQISLLSGFRRGIFHKQLAICSSIELKQLLPIVAQTICQLPFGLTEFRSTLFVILAERISSNASLDQAWRFFLNCNRDIPEIMRTWESHEYLKPETTENNAHTDQYTAGTEDIDIIYTDTEQKRDNTKTTDTQIIYTDDEKKTDHEPKDCVTFFRSLLTDLNKIGSKKTIAPSKFICDPINDNILVQVKLKAIMPSNAKPYLLDIYGLNEQLSSTILLKKGDDLRKDLGCMLMFKLMNDIWKENRVNFRGQNCQTLVYNVVPMAVDFGAIEFVSGATKIKDIDKIIWNIQDRDVLDVTMDRLIATGAASYVASYILGVRDRHHDNILVCADGSLFNIDFSHILGDKLGGFNIDAATIAVPKMFVKVLGNENWIAFVEVAVICFNVLRKNYIHLLDFARIAFAFLKSTEENEAFLKHSLMIDMDNNEALKKIKSKLDKAPSRVSTKIKNAFHTLAVKKKSLSISS